jgi:methylenetetrahydrofolate reductase (NADPH)
MSDNHFRAALEEGRFVYTAELVLGRDHQVPEAEAFVREAGRHQGEVRVISLTDLPGGNPALAPESFLSFVLDQGLTPLAHLTGKDCNRAGLESRLLSLARMGIENVLALTGDMQKDAFLGRAKPVYDLDSVLILWLLEAMKAGIEYRLGSRKIQSQPFGFFGGAVVNPFKVRQADQMMQFYKLQLKIATGARFIIPQLGFNLRKLYELRQFMIREGLGHIPALANVYVPTAKIARLMQEGELAGCVVPESLIQRLEKETKPERLSRAALMVAAARDLGFAGAHIGGFGLEYRDFLTIIEQSEQTGKAWRTRLDELIFETDGEFYLLPEGTEGLSDGAGDYQLELPKRGPGFGPRLSGLIHRCLVSPDSRCAGFLSRRFPPLPAPDDHSWRKGFWYRLLGLSTLYRKAVFGCADCGDCIQDHLAYAGCSMRWCYKNLRNGPCGGSRPDGSCETAGNGNGGQIRPCIWNQAYDAVLAAGEDPRRFSETLIPPRDWSLDRTNSLVNRLVGLDGAKRRVPVEETPTGLCRAAQPSQGRNHHPRWRPFRIAGFPARNISK